jgi:xylulokinase
LATDRGDASGTGYWSPTTGEYRDDLLHLGFGAKPALPRVLRPSEAAGTLASGAVVGPGTGDNAAAALGVGAATGDVIVSIGTSGVVCAVSATPTSDASGLVAGFADATGQFLPLCATLNAARVLDATARLLGVTLDELSRLALSAPSGADSLVVVPYLDGERTPNRPDATGAVHGLRQSNTTPANLARAAVEGLLCGLADGLDALRAQGVAVSRVQLVGGGAKSDAVRQIAPAVLGVPVVVPVPGEYVADGAARQAAWVLSGSPEPPAWRMSGSARYEADWAPDVRARYAEVRDLTAKR